MRDAFAWVGGTAAECRSPAEGALHLVSNHPGHGITLAAQAGDRALAVGVGPVLAQLGLALDGVDDDLDADDGAQATTEPPGSKSCPASRAAPANPYPTPPASSPSSPAATSRRPPAPPAPRPRSGGTPAGASPEHAQDDAALARGGLRGVRLGVGLPRLARHLGRHGPPILASPLSGAAPVLCWGSDRDHGRDMGRRDPAAAGARPALGTPGPPVDAAVGGLDRVRVARRTRDRGLCRPGTGPRDRVLPGLIGT